MRPDKLDEMIQQSLIANETPFLVALTSGTTGKMWSYYLNLLKHFLV